VGGRDETRAQGEGVAVFKPKLHSILDLHARTQGEVGVPKFANRAGLTSGWPVMLGHMEGADCRRRLRWLAGCRLFSF
jgi:hypothetical protein